MHHDPQCFQNQERRVGAAKTGPGMSVLDNILETIQSLYEVCVSSAK